MSVRFTEVIKHAGKDIGSYFIQESSDQGAPSFRVIIKDDRWVTLKLYKQGENNWTIVPQDLPIWVLDLQDELQSIIQKKIKS